MAHSSPEFEQKNTKGKSNLGKILEWYMEKILWCYKPPQISVCVYREREREVGLGLTGKERDGEERRW
jgi:hypothetical protein